MRSLVRGGALVVVAFWVVAFGSVAGSQAGIGVGWETLYEDSAAHYPEGFPAHYIRALSATRTGDRDAALSHLESYVRTGVDLNLPLSQSPHFSALEGDARYDELRRLAARRVVAALGDRTHPDYVVRVALALIELEEFDDAIERLETALEMGGPQRSTLFTHLMSARGARDAHARGEKTPRAQPKPPIREGPLVPL